LEKEREEREMIEREKRRHVSHTMLAKDRKEKIEDRPLGRNCRRTLLTQLTDRF